MSNRTAWANCLNYDLVRTSQSTSSSTMRAELMLRCRILKKMLKLAIMVGTGTGQGNKEFETEMDAMHTSVER